MTGKAGLCLASDDSAYVAGIELTGPAESRTHDYIRHGTSSLFAALDVTAGTVIGKCMPRHHTREFHKFLDEVERNVPAGLDVHLVMDN